MKQSVSPAVMVAVIVVVVVIAAFFGFRAMNGGADGDVGQARINMYKNAKGAIGAGSGGNTSAPAGGSESKQ